MAVDWDAIIAEIDAHYDKKYFSGFGYKEDDPLNPVVPLKDFTEFFGTGVLNFLILRSEVDADSYTDSSARLASTFDQFAKYQTMVWLYDPSDSLDDTSIIDMCEAIEGFIYMGKLDDTVTADYFYTFADPHFIEEIS